jgi:hypothetical protein
LKLSEVFEVFERPPDIVHGDERVLSVLNTLATNAHEAMGEVTVKDLVTGRFSQSPT